MFACGSETLAPAEDSKPSEAAGGDSSGELNEGFDSFALAPGANTGVIPFAQDELDAGLVKSLLANPSSLVLQPAGYEMVNADATNFVFLTEETFARTALIVIDYGDGKVDRFRVATNVDHEDDGRYAGVRLEQVLDNAGIDFQVAEGPDGSEVLAQIGDYEPLQHQGPAKALVDPAYPEGQEPSARMARRFWVTYAAREDGEVRVDGDFGAIVVRPRDEIYLAYTMDEDRDGVFAREEFVRGSSDHDTQSDATDTAPSGDGLSDYYEARIGWEVVLEGDLAPEPYRVFPSPVLMDTDGDGLDDREELALGTDPTLRDTDGDGVLDPEDPRPLKFENTAPLNQLTIESHLNAVTLTGSITDLEKNLSSVVIHWGDGHSEHLGDLTVAADLEVTHHYSRSDDYIITVVSTDSTSLADVDTFPVTVTSFPNDPVVYLPYSRANEDLFGCEQSTDHGVAAVTDRFGNVFTESCFFGQSPGSPLFNQYQSATLGSNATIAAWIRPSHADSNAFAVGEEGYPALSRSQNNEHMAFIINHDGALYEAADPSGLENGEWAFYVGVLEDLGQDSELRLYKNGRLQATTKVPNYQHVDGSCPFSVGGHSGSCDTWGSKGFQGAFDDVRAFDRALNLAEVQALFNEPE